MEGEKKEVIIPCMHLTGEWTVKRVVEVKIEYCERVRMIDCETEYSSSTIPCYTINLRNEADIYLKGISCMNCNPVDCEECKADVIEYLTFGIAHPDPHSVLADLNAQLYDYIHHNTPTPSVSSDSLKNCFPMIHLQDHFKIRGNSDIEEVSYCIINCIERHCLPQRQERNEREWRVSWVGARHPQPLHPRLYDLKLDKVNHEGIDFTCSICLQSQVNKVAADDKKVETKKRQGATTSYCSNRKKRRLRGNFSRRVAENIISDKETEVEHKEDDLVALPCNHIYHESCINLWLQDARNTCPICRIQLPNSRNCSAWNPSYQPVSSLGRLSVLKY